MSERLISVALPVRNGADFIADALESLMSQSMTDFAIYISDNASDDGTEEIIADFSAQDSRIKVSRSPQLISQVANMNRALALADTPWVRMLCHDDTLRSDCMAQSAAAVRLVAGSKVGLIGNGERHLFANGYLTPAKNDGALQVIAGTDVVAANIFGRGEPSILPSVTTATVYRPAFESIGRFDPRFAHFDIFAWLRLLMNWDYAWLPSQLTVNRIHSRQVASDARAALRSVFDYKAFVAEFGATAGPVLEAGYREKLRCRFLPLGVAATTLAVELYAGRADRVWRAIGALPKLWLPALVPLTLRALIREKKRVAQLRAHVPLNLVYP